MDIKSVSDFIAECEALQSEKTEGSLLFFRGVNTIYSPEKRHQPSIYYKSAYIQNEHLLFKEILARFPDEMLAQRTTIERLILMQHNGFPTRIMDISRNPLIALFFSCFADKGQEDSQNKDGVVYVYSVPEDKIKYCESDAVSIVANLCKQPFDFSIAGIKRDCSDPDERKSFNEEEVIMYLHYDIQEEKPHFHPVIDCSDIGSVICLRPRMNNARIIRQDGYFFLFGIDDEKKNCAAISEEWIKEPIPIASDRKTALIESLDRLNINEAFVYPDYKHTNEDLRRKYEKQVLTFMKNRNRLK
jgi:hypothetical protein